MFRFTNKHQGTLEMRCSQKLCKIEKKRLCQSLFFNKMLASGLNFLKKRLCHRFFPVNFAKFLRTPFLQDTSGRLVLHHHVESWPLKIVHSQINKRSNYTLYFTSSTVKPSSTLLECALFKVQIGRKAETPFNIRLNNNRKVNNVNNLKSFPANFHFRKDGHSLNLLAKFTLNFFLKATQASALKAAYILIVNTALVNSKVA